MKMDYEEITATICLVLILGMMKTMSFRDKEELTKDVLKLVHKENCEMAQDILKESYKVTNYEKFAEMIQRCDVAQLLSATAKNAEMGNRLMQKIVEKFADDCLERI